MIINLTKSPHSCKFVYVGKGLYSTYKVQCPYLKPILDKPSLHHSIYKLIKPVSNDFQKEIELHGI